MGSCLSAGLHPEKKPKVRAVNHAKKTPVPGANHVEEIVREVEHSSESSSLSTSGGSEVLAAVPDIPRVVLDPSIWEHLPDDLTRFVLGKLPLSTVIHLRCVSKQWNTWILSSTIASPLSFNDLVEWRVHPLIIFMYTLILVRDLDNQSQETQMALSGRSSLARFVHIKLRLEAHYADIFGWRPRVDAA